MFAVLTRYLGANRDFLRTVRQRQRHPVFDDGIIRDLPDRMDRIFIIYTARVRLRQRNGLSGGYFQLAQGIG